MLSMITEDYLFIQCRVSYETLIVSYKHSYDHIQPEKMKVIP